MPKRKIISPVKRLKLRCEELWKKVCKERDGLECQVKKHFPELRRHTDIMQVDHFITRSNKNLFFSVFNGTVICSGCNMSKKIEPNGPVDIAVEQIVIKREGEATVADMKALALTMRANDNFSKVWWLEDTIKLLEAQYEYYKD